jgi:hypothetical protein
LAKTRLAVFGSRHNWNSLNRYHCKRWLEHACAVLGVSALRNVSLVYVYLSLVPIRCSDYHTYVYTSQSFQLLLLFDLTETSIRRWNDLEKVCNTAGLNWKPSSMVVRRSFGRASDRLPRFQRSFLGFQSLFASNKHIHSVLLSTK